MLAGSIGKHTEIKIPDFDMVCFLNDTSPSQFTEVMEHWEDILLMNDNNASLKIDQGSIQKSGTSFQFKIGQVDVDLLPAANMVPKDKRLPSLGGRKLAEAQLKEVSAVIMDEKTSQAYSSSLSESQVYFMKDQSPLAHQVIFLLPLICLAALLCNQSQIHLGLYISSLVLN